MTRWPEVNLRRLAKLGTGHTPSRQHPEYWENCTIPWLTLADVWQLRDGTKSRIGETSEKISEVGLANSSAVVHPAGTVAMSRTASVGFSCILDRDMATSQDFVTWKCGPLLEPRFLFHSLRGQRDWILGMRMGSTHQTIYMPDVERITTPLPPIAQQRAIADFLDTETARIDALIAKKRRLIEMLNERAAAAADRLVLGADCEPAVPSRTEFFQSVPAAWGETPLRHLSCHVQTGPFGSQLHAEDYVLGGWPVVNPANLRGGTITALDSMAVSDEKRAELSRHILLCGDIVFGRRGELGRAGLVAEEHVGWLCGTGSLRLRLAASSLLRPDYLKLLLETTALRRYFELTSVGSTMDNLNADIVLGMPCMVPPLQVQASIVSTVQVLRSRTATLRGRLTVQISLLREHRQAMITAAVTGELEVPGMVA